MDVVRSMDEAIDIHHIFPEDYCKEKGYPKEKWNSIINKTPLLPESNRAIGGEAPSIYKDKILNRTQISMAQLQERLESHWVDVDAFLQDDFERYFIARAKKMLLVIEEAMGKSVADKASEQTIKQFGQSLA